MYKIHARKSLPQLVLSSEIPQILILTHPCLLADILLFSTYPKFLLFQRLIKMNMPLDENETIQFTTTLFALVRTSLQIRMTGNMNANDTKLRKMITEDWPNIMPRVLDKMIPKQSGKKWEEVISLTSE